MTVASTLAINVSMQTINSLAPRKIQDIVSVG